MIDDNLSNASTDNTGYTPVRARNDPRLRAFVDASESERTSLSYPCAVGLLLCSAVLGVASVVWLGRQNDDYMSRDSSYIMSLESELYAAADTNRNRYLDTSEILEMLAARGSNLVIDGSTSRVHVYGGPSKGIFLEGGVVHMPVVDAQEYLGQKGVFVPVPKKRPVARPIPY